MIYQSHISNVSIDVNFRNKDHSRMHHALGCPLFPRNEHYRNRFVVTKGSQAAKELEGNPNWKSIPSVLGLSQVFFEVTSRGRSELAAVMATLDLKTKLFHTQHPTVGELTVQAPNLDLAKRRLRTALLVSGDETAGSIDAAVAVMKFEEVQ